MALDQNPKVDPVIVNGTHTLKIQGYSFTKDMGTGKSISSDAFSVGGHSWKIQFYPDGYKVGNNNESDDVHVSLYIYLVSKGEVEAYTEYALLDQIGNKCTMKKGTEFTIGPKMTGPDMITTAGRGYQKFYKRTELEASQFIINDCLNIQCTVGVVKKLMDCPKQVTQSSELRQIRQRYGQLLDSKEGSDVTFEVEGETFYAHKLILSTWSPVFKAQFYGPLKEVNTHSIKIEEIQAPVFKALLHFIYYDVIPGEEDLGGLEDIMMIQHLLVAADRYGSQRLKSLCESILCQNISENTVGSTLALSEQHGCIQLKSTCLEFIVQPENLYAVMQTDGFKNLKESLPSLLEDLIKALGRVKDYTCVTYGLE